MIMHRMLKRMLVFVGLIFAASLTHAAQGEMGTGIPKFGVYTAGTGVSITIFLLEDATTPFPPGCGSLTLIPATMGMDSYKIAAATQLAARISSRRVHFYAHAVRDGGCGVDFVELV